jgi:hypothetical protein
MDFSQDFSFCNQAHRYLHAALDCRNSDPRAIFVTRALYKSIKGATQDAGLKMTHPPNPHRVNLERKELIKQVGVKSADSP